MIRPKNIKVYQKDRDKGKRKVGGPPLLKITDNVLSPPVDTPPVDTTDSQLTTKSIKIPFEDTNLEFEVLYTINIDAQEVNVVVDRQTTEDKRKDVTTKSPVTAVDVNINT